MRLGTAFAIALYLLPCSAMAQSRADRLPSTSPESPAPASPLPPPGENQGAERPDPRAIRQVDPQEKASLPKLKPSGPLVDTLDRHVAFGGMLAHYGHYGRLDATHSASSLLGSAIALGIDAGYGISSHFALGLEGSYVSHSSGDNCSHCSATSWAVGPFVRYHIVQGVRFDPWLALGVSLSSFSLETDAASLQYLGAELFDLRVGGDWYASRNFGFGPVLGLKLLRYFDTPDSATARSSAAMFLAVRGVIDLPGK